MGEQVAIDPVSAFEALTIESIDKAIADLEAEIEAWNAPKIKRMDSLRACRRAVDIRENGMAQRKSRGRSKKDEAPEKPASSQLPSSASKLDRIVTLLKVGGSMKPEAIASQLNIACNDDLRDILRDDRYFKTEGWGKIGLKQRS